MGTVSGLGCADRPSLPAHALAPQDGTQIKYSFQPEEEVLIHCIKLPSEKAELVAIQKRTDHHLPPNPD